jgi:hypothetical protein
MYLNAVAAMHYAIQNGICQGAANWRCKAVFAS